MLVRTGWARRQARPIWPTPGFQRAATSRGAPHRRRGRSRRRGDELTSLPPRETSLRRCAGSLAALLAAAARGSDILAFGDSLTAGSACRPEQAFPARLEARLHERRDRRRVVNAGVSGDTTADGLARLDWALADKPDLVILELGANDALRGIEPSTVRANLDAMIGKIQATGAKVLLLGMLAPPNWGEDYKRAFDQIYPELARAPRRAALSVFSRRCGDEPGAQSARRPAPERAGRRRARRPHRAASSPARSEAAS